ncbi:MAG: type I methionyl aminopeptidase [Negativicutes bacterium]|nr:type I methionyl aminopeptidase [Negativicutes bacterium]
MIILKSEQEIKMMHEAGKVLAACHREIEKLIKPGISTAEIDQFVEKYLAQRGATPEQKGYRGYQYATCASVNDEICHGFPNHKKLRNGDIVTIDFVVNLHGALADSAWTHSVGNVSDNAKRLMKIAKESMYKGIEQAQAGNRLGDIGHAIQSYVEHEGFSVVRDFTGHGIGRNMHEDPAVPNYGEPGKGTKLVEGMVITIEPMVNMGSYHCKIDKNGWTARTVDGKLSTQYEHTVALTHNGPLILTE